MVYNRMVGRLGNQAFSIMATISYALKHGLEYHIPDHTASDSVWSPVFKHLTNPNFNPGLETITLKESGMPYFEIPFEEEWRDKNIELDGYWQSYPYFIEYLPQIREAFAIPDIMGFENRTSIHIRRSDFLMYPTKHPCVSEYYLDQAIDLLRDHYRVPIKYMVVSTDDISWAKDFFNKRAMDVGYAVDFFSGETQCTPYINWMMMANCKNHVLSNSTYSYTAAMLSNNEYKVVICPDEDNWYGENNKHIDVSNLIPKEWIRIKY